MVNEEKTRIMIKVARHEKELGEKVINEGSYYKSDYVHLHTLSVIFNFQLHMHWYLHCLPFII